MSKPNDTEDTATQAGRLLGELLARNAPPDEPDEPPVLPEFD